MRDRLVKLVKVSLTKHIGKSCKLAENIVDDLLKDGVVVPPVKVGDTMWVLSKDLTTIQSVVITDVYCRWHKMGVCTTLVTDNPFAYLFGDYEIGIKIFFTKEDAKKVLEERNKK